MRGVLRLPPARFVSPTCPAGSARQCMATCERQPYVPASCDRVWRSMLTPPHVGGAVAVRDARPPATTCSSPRAPGPYRAVFGCIRSINNPRCYGRPARATATAEPLQRRDGPVLRALRAGLVHRAPVRRRQRLPEPLQQRDRRLLSASDRATGGRSRPRELPSRMVSAVRKPVLLAVVEVALALAGRAPEEPRGSSPSATGGPRGLPCPGRRSPARGCAQGGRAASLAVVPEVLALAEEAS